MDRASCCRLDRLCAWYRERELGVFEKGVELDAAEVRKEITRSYRWVG